MGATDEAAGHAVSTSTSRTTTHPIGTRLQSARAERGLSLDDVAAKVLLSPSQIRGLEQGDPKAFYSPSFYNQGLRKYAALLGVPDALLNDAVLAVVSAPAVQAPPVMYEASVAADDAPRWGARIAAVAAVIAIVAAAAAGIGWWRTQEAARVAAAAEPVPPPPMPDAPPVTQAPALTPTPAEPAADVEAADAVDPASLAQAEPAVATAAPLTAVATTATTAAATNVTPVPGTAANGTAGPYGTVRAGSSTWLFVRYADGDTEQRNLDAFASFTLIKRPVYLVLGTTDVVLTVRGRRIDVAPWVTEGEVRINGRAFAATPLLADAPAP
jgi:cytoskeletal protein RodZ